MEQKQKTIYDLELHEILQINIDTAVMKVHGGWIYTLCLVDPSSNKFLAVHNTFVPYEEPKKLNERSPITGKILD